MIPVPVPAGAMPVLASERRFTVLPDHPLYDDLCPVCDGLLGELVAVLVFAGIEPERRKPGGRTTGAAVAVHAMCAGVPEEEPETPPRTVTYDLSDSARRHVLIGALGRYADGQQTAAAAGIDPDRNLTLAAHAKDMQRQAATAAGEEK